MKTVSILTIGDFRSIPGFDHYFVTSDGRIFSDFWSGRSFENRKRFLPTGIVRQMSTSTDKTGYPKVVLVSGGRRKWLSVHSIVLTAFRCARPEGMECRHLDGNRANCDISNLEWGTPVENAADRRRHGTQEFGEKHHACKLSDDDVIVVMNMIRDGEKQKNIAAHFGVHRTCISAIATGRNRSYLKLQGAFV